MAPSSYRPSALAPAPALLAVALAALLLPAAPGCGGGGGGSDSPGGTGTSGTGASTQTGASTAVNDAHWQVALAALGQSYQPTPPAFDAVGLAQWTALLHDAWPALRTMMEPLLEQQIALRIPGQSSGSVTSIAVRSVDLEFDDTPRISSTAPNQIILEFPGAPGGWRGSVTLDITASFNTTIFGITFPTTIAADATLAIEDIRIYAPATFDLSDPKRPKPIGTASPQVSMRLVLSSNTTGLQQLAPAITNILDPVIRAALFAGGLYLQQELTGMLQQAPVTPWGLNGPGLTALSAPAPDLDQLALTISESIQRDHTPFGTVVETTFSLPGYGNGVPVAHGGFADSAIWTGHYLMGEAVRYDLTGDPAALAAATKVFNGLNMCLDVSRFDGQLSRCIVPVTSPHLTSITHDLDYSVGTVDGQAYGTLGDISRDQYLGAFMGFTQSYLRLPTLRDRARGLVSRMIDYLDRNEWIAFKVDGVTPARGLFAVTPHVTWAALKAANLVDRARWGGLHDANQGLSAISWFTMWTSNLDVMSSYYKFNLQHAALTILVSTETDPLRYRDYLRVVEIMRDGTGHHLSAWFDAAYGMAVPSAAPVIGPLVKGELERWALRDRRQHAVDLTSDPTIQKAQYSSSLMAFSHMNTALSSGGAPMTIEVAAYPVPIEKRAHSDFLWQRNPFQLTGWGNPTHQAPGVDMVLPYWVGRSFGLFR